jgi:hypothetical protein
LRDYRFYNEDMVHPSDPAINYIWEVFSRTYLDDAAVKIWNEALKITKARNHRFNTDSSSKRRDFAQKILNNISELEIKAPSIDFSEERSYFLNILNI